MYTQTTQKALKAAEQGRPAAQEARKAFAIEIAAFDPRRLVFLDEFGCNTKMTRRFARAIQGHSAYGKCPVNYGQNASIVGAVRLDGFAEALVINGAFDGKAFLSFIT